MQELLLLLIVNFLTVLVHLLCSHILYVYMKQRYIDELTFGWQYWRFLDVFTSIMLWSSLCIWFIDYIKKLTHFICFFFLIHPLYSLIRLNALLVSCYVYIYQPHIDELAFWWEYGFFHVDIVIIVVVYFYDWLFWKSNILYLFLFLIHCIQALDLMLYRWTVITTFGSNIMYLISSYRWLSWFVGIAAP